jgi:UDPglucose--hexose-1-phosphate uridylyltransferase
MPREEDVVSARRWFEFQKKAFATGKDVHMAGIRFESSESKVTFLNPLNGFAEETHTVEVRKDPLLGGKSIYNPAVRNKVKFFFGDCDVGLIDKMVEDSAKTCIFCGEKLEMKTPRYTQSLVPEGRIRVGEAVLFPNLYPVGKYHSVIALSKAHFLKLAEFSPEIISDGLRAAQCFVKTVYKHDEEALFVAVNANYLFPAGATLVHPHLQMLITPTAYSYHERLIQACRSYYQENRSEYYPDLIEQEKAIGSRYIAQSGGWHWLAAFSPLGNNEIVAVHEKEHDFVVLSDSDLIHLASGISKVLKLYDSLGHLSFNYSIYSARTPSGEGFRCVLKMISRQNLYPNYRNDDFFLQKLLHTELIINLPEELATEMQKLFQEA